MASTVGGAKLDQHRLEHRMLGIGAGSSAIIDIGASIPSGTVGSVLFIGTGSVLAEDNANLFYNDTTNFLGVGTTSPDGKVHIDNGTSNTELIIEKDATTTAGIVFHNAGVAAANITFNASEDIVIENDTTDRDIIFKILDGAVDTEMGRIDGSVSRWGFGTATPSVFFNVEGNTVFNDDGNDVDFRVEGDTATNLLLIDASQDSVKVGTTVAGAIAFWGTSGIVYNETGLDLDYRIESVNQVNCFRLDASNDQVQVHGGSVARLSNALITFNEANADVDIVFSSVLQNNMLYINAGVDMIGIGTNLPSTLLHLGKAGTLKGTLGFAGDTSGLVTIQPAAAAGTWTLTLPTNDGDAGQFLQTNGSGVTSWVAGSSGSVTSVDVSGGTTGLTTSGGPITTSGTITLAGTLAIANGGTGATTALGAFNALSVTTTRGDLITRDASNNVRLAIGTTGKFLKTDGTDPSWQSITVSDIGSGAALTKADDTNVTLTLGGSPTTALLAATSITAGWTGTLAAARLNANVVQSVVNDTNVTGSIATQALTLGWTGTLAVARGGTGAGTLTGLLQGNGTSAITAITNSSTVGQVLRVTGASTYAWGALDLADTDAVTGTLAVANGGTSLATLTAHALYVGNGTSAPTALSVGATNTVLMGATGADPGWQSDLDMGTGIIQTGADDGEYYSGDEVKLMAAVSVTQSYPSPGVSRFTNSAAPATAQVQWFVRVPQQRMGKVVTLRGMTFYYSGVAATRYITSNLWYEYNPSDGTNTNPDNDTTDITADTEHPMSGFPVTLGTDESDTVIIVRLNLNFTTSASQTIDIWGLEVTWDTD